MKDQFDQKHGVVRKEFEVGNLVYAKQWKPPHFHWMKGTVMRRIGRVNYEVMVGDEMCKKHANQLRHRSDSEQLAVRQQLHQQSEALNILLDVLTEDDALRRNGNAAEGSPEQAIASDVPAPVDSTTSTSTSSHETSTPPPTLRRSSRTRRPVQRFQSSP